MVRAKFKVTEKTLRAGHNGDHSTVVILAPVTHGSPENDSFYRWTPCGRIELSVVNAETGNKFELGKEYYVDFTIAE